MDKRNKTSSFLPVFLLILGITHQEFVFAASILKCKSQSGATVFTDSIINCALASSSNKNKIEKIEIEHTNLHSQFGKTVSKEYYNYAFRAYQPIKGYSIKLTAEKKLMEEHPKLLARAATKLEYAASRALATFPARVRHELSGVQYYMFSGDEARTGGRKGGQWYLRKGNKISSQFDDSVVIRSAKDYLTLSSNKRAAQTAVHELSHAYYFYHRARIYWEINKAFKNAKNKSLYINVKHENGGVVKKGYAITNQVEYFAELSQMLHIGNHYYPFNASDLEKYDPKGFKAIKNAFYYK